MHEYFSEFANILFVEVRQDLSDTPPALSGGSCCRSKYSESAHDDTRFRRNAPSWDGSARPYARPKVRALTFSDKIKSRAYLEVELTAVDPFPQTGSGTLLETEVEGSAPAYGHLGQS